MRAVASTAARSSPADRAVVLPAVSLNLLMIPSRYLSFPLLLLVAIAAPRALLAQRPVDLRLGVQAIGVMTSVEAIPGSRSLTEARVVQPVIMLDAVAFNGHLRFTGALNLEGQTIPRGELAPGAWGEGYNDRRHPHTYAHELMLSGVDLLGGLDGAGKLSVSAGKGFAPFGSDDPMSRPVVRYPVNHHLAQVLERAVVIAGYRTGPLLLEGALFNGDEPERPGQWPLLSRFGDSWSVRLTAVPVTGIELSVSRAKIHSPEHRPGAGTDAWKWHVASRVDRPVGGAQLYGLAEWARTEEADGFFVFTSLLAETAVQAGRHRPYYRFERSDRPEDLRTLDLFRSVRPHLENAILGITRFTLHTVGYGVRVGPRQSPLLLEPFVEATLGSAHSVDGGVLTPAILYGTTRVRSLSIGLRAAWGMAGHRMGRYGALLGTGQSPETSHDHPM